MGGGLFQLAAYGIMDKKYLLGNPSNSYFKSIFKKYSNFSSETKRTYFNTDFDFGKKIKVTIPKIGDLIMDMYIEIELPKINSNQNQTVGYINSVALALIKNIKLKIGDQLIVEHYGDWNNIWSQFTVASEKKICYNNLIGKYGFINSNLDSEGGIYIVPLHFWFCNNPGLALPLASLQYHSITLEFELRDFNELWISSDGNPPIGNYNIKKGILYTENIYLDREERLNFSQNPQTYLIKQLQVTEYPVRERNYNLRINLDFNHPVIELIWIYQRDDIKNKGPELGNDWFNYSKDLTEPHSEPIISAKLVFNGMDRTEQLSAKYFRLLQPLKKHTSVPDNYIYSFSFSLFPEINDPNGVCNFSRIDNAELHIELDHQIPKGIIRVYAVNFNILRFESGMAGIEYSN